MSHLTTIKTVYNDVEALREAVESYGLTLKQGGQCRFFSGQPHVDYLVAMPGKYDVGFNQNSDGTLSIVCDSELYKPTIYNGQTSEPYRLWGPQFEGLTTEYNTRRATTIYQQKGYTVTRETRQDGSVKLIAQRG